MLIPPLGMNLYTPHGYVNRDAVSVLQCLSVGHSTGHQRPQMNGVRERIASTTGHSSPRQSA